MILKNIMRKSHRNKEDKLSMRLSSIFQVTLENLAATIVVNDF